MTTEDVVVVGGGVIGVCCAEALARAGRTVLLIERERLCSGSSWGNSGLLTTSASAPEAAPGVIRQATRWMLDRDGPFRLRPRLDPRLLRWVRHFRAQCTAAAALAATAYLRDRVRDNIRLVAEQAERSPIDFAFRTNGILVLYETERGLTEGATTARALGELGIPSELIDRRGVMRLEPRAANGVLGGVLYSEDAHIDPSAYVDAVAELGRRHGVRIQEGNTVVRLHGSHRVEVVETTTSLLRPQLVVVANGAWASGLLEPFGEHLLVEAGKGFSLSYDVGARIYDRPLRLHEIRTVVSSMATKVRVTSKLDLVGLDTRVRERRIRVGAARAKRYVSLPEGLDQAKAWAGLRPLAPDGLPYIGRSSMAANAIVATGHGHLGVSLAAVTAEAVARLAVGDEPSFDLHPVRPDRFARGTRLAHA